ncbi:MAG: sulfite exporter TauE/SafE family protein [Pseudomonadota bacterium]
MEAGLVFLLAGAAAGGFINGLAGFGTSLFALGWWLQVMAPVEAVALSLVMSVLSGLQGVWVVRGSITWARLGPFLLPALFGIPIGLAILHRVDAGLLKLMVASFLLVFAGYFIARRNLPSITRDTPWVDRTTGFLGGILGAIAGLSGALPTMWTTLKPWTKEVRRAVLQPYNVAVLGLAAALLAAQGAYDREALIRIAIALPATMAASQVGIWAFKRLTDAQFRWLVIGLMFTSGGVLMLREIAA